MSIALSALQHIMYGVSDAHRWENIHFSPSKPRHVTPQNQSSQKNKHYSESFNTHLQGFLKEIGGNTCSFFETKPMHVTPQIDRLGKMDAVLSVSTHNVWDVLMRT